MIEAVIFDMDGTLVDSERIGIEGWRRTAEEMGLDVPLAFVKSFIGRTPPTIKAMLAERFGDADVAERSYERCVQIRRALSETDLVTKPGAVEVVRALHADGYRIELATSSPRAVAESNLSRFGILEFFDVITSGEEVTNGKPHPEMYELAARKLGLDPVACAAVEDSPNGVRSAAAAGLRVFMVPDVIEPTPEIAALCHHILPSLHELPASIAADSAAQDAGEGR